MKILKSLGYLFICIGILTEQLPAQDIHNVDEITDLYFDRISGQAKQHDWSSFKSLFLPTTQFNAIGINENGENEFYPQSLEEFIQHLKEYTETSGFFQKSLERSKIQYGRMAQMITVYESRNSPSGNIIDRVLISFHLVQKEERWWIASILWNSETKKNPLPENFLK